MKNTLLLLALSVLAIKANAQIAILQSTINKLQGYKSFSYDYTIKHKEPLRDTTLTKNKFVLLKVPENKDIGYYFRNDLNLNTANPFSKIYNGETLVQLSSLDSTYNVFKTPAANVFRGSILGQLGWLTGFLDKNPTKIKQGKDTVYNAANAYHLVVSNKDTVINNEHLYIITHLYINKQTLLPIAQIVSSRTNEFGKAIITGYTEHKYFNIIQNDLDASAFSLPAVYHLPKPKPIEETAFLTAGTPAPDWTLYDTDGKKITLSQLKGKVVLLDFFFVGCINCMESLGPLDKLYEKYKNKNVTLLSITFHDHKKLATAFKKLQKIKNKVLYDGEKVSKTYHVDAGPTFYFIDKDGKIATVIEGYTAGFEKKTTGIIEDLLKKS